MVSRRAQAPADIALTFECERGYTFDPAVWGQEFGRSSAKRPLAARRQTVGRASRRRVERSEKQERLRAP